MTETELANKALAFAKMSGINNIDDTTDPAIACKALLPDARKVFIVNSKLHRTRKESALALSAGETSVVYDYVYTEPADLLHAIEIWNGNTAADPILYEVGTHSSLTKSIIKTDYADAVLIYLTDITNLNVYKPADILAMAYLLASFISMPLKLDERLALFNGQQYLITLKTAIANDRNSQKIDVVNNARYSDIERSRR